MPVPPYQQPERIGELLRRHLDRHGFSHVSMEPLGFRFPGKSASDHPAVQAAIQIVSDFYQTEPVVFPISEWIGAPIWELAEPLGMPYFSVGTNADTSRFHVPDESIELDDFRQSIKFMATLIHELATDGRVNDN